MNIGQLKNNICLNGCDGYLKLAQPSKKRSMRIVVYGLSSRDRAKKRVCIAACHPDSASKGPMAAPARGNPNK